MLTSRSKKKGIKVIPTWQFGETVNFTSLDSGQDIDIEPILADDWDSDYAGAKKESGA
jgi:hypothetical protein